MSNLQTYEYKNFSREIRENIAFTVEMKYLFKMFQDSALRSILNDEIIEFNITH